ncbi:MAG TPA: ATP-binding protein [Oleiagrimonas sp.]|nr:ATP-binding protein [Oleiagrimonas sp.]
MLAFRPRLAVVAAVLFLLAAGAATAFQYRNARNDRLRQVRAQASVVAASVTAAIAFNDRAAAQEYVNALKLNPGLDAAAVYDQQGRHVAGFHRDGGAPIPNDPTLASASRDGKLLVAVSARQGAMRMGTVYLRAAPIPWTVTAARFSGIALLTLMAIIFLSLLGLGQRALMRSHASLLRQTTELAEANARLGEEMEQRLRTEEALHQSRKMEAVGQISGGIAHDFNNLLMVLKGSLALFVKRLQQSDEAFEQLDAAARAQIAADPARDMQATRDVLDSVLEIAEQRRARRPQLDRYLTAAEDGIERAASLTQRLLSFARRQPLTPSSVNLDELVRKMQPLLEHSLTPLVYLRYELASRWLVLCDPNQMENAILNLVINARDALPDGGDITIRTTDVVADAAAESEASDLGDHVWLAVADTGAGMSEEIRRKAFEPFYTTKPMGKGTGLGLSTIHGYVLQSNGQVSIDSEPGHGTTIHIRMPRTHVAATADTETLS